jgi:HSP20 family protein
MAQTTPAKKTDGALARREPLDFVEAMQAEMDRFFRPFGFGLFAPRDRQAPAMRLPHTDIYEEGHDLIVSAELPGITKDNIAVTFEQGDLVIKGEQKSEQETKEKDFYRMERHYGSYYRRIPLSFEAKPEQMTASFKDGVLEVHIPKPAVEQAKAQQIPVK